MRQLMQLLIDRTNELSIIELRKLYIYRTGLHSAVVARFFRTEGPGLDPRWRRTLEQGISHMVNLTVLVITQEDVSVLYSGHVKEPEGLFEKELGTTKPGPLYPTAFCLPLDFDGFHQE